MDTEIQTWTDTWDFRSRQVSKVTTNLERPAPQGSIRTPMTSESAWAMRSQSSLFRLFENIGRKPCAFEPLICCCGCSASYKKEKESG
jgi:hypothetical protein